VLGILGLVVVLILLALIAPFFISVDTYKNQLITQVESATGRTLTIGGKLSIRFFPSAGITVEDVTLSNPTGFADKNPFVTLSNPTGFADKNPFVTLKTLTLDVAVAPLLNKEIVIKNFELKDPVINLVATNDGQNNWILTPHNIAPSKQGASEKPVSEDVHSDIPAHSGKALLKNFVLNNFELSNGIIRYTKGSAAPVEITKINTKVQLQSSEASALITGSVDWNGKTISLKAGIGTLKTMFMEQKMEINATLKSDLMNASINGNYDKGTFNGKETFKTESLKELIAWATPGKPIATPAKLALQSDSEVYFNASQCNLFSLHVLLDAIDAKGSIKVSWGNAKPLVDIKLAADELDFNPFLPPQKEANLNSGYIISDADAAAGERWSSEPIDLGILNQFDAKADIQTNGVKLHKFALGKTHINATLQQGILTSDATAENVYQGTGSINATVNANAAAPSFDTRVVLKSIALAPFLKDTINNENMSGQADIQANLKSSIRSVNALISDLSGNGDVKVNNGELKHVNLLDMLHNSQAAFGAPSSKSTVFTQLGGSFTIAQGVVSNHDFIMDTQGMRVGGDGSVNLPAYTINYRLKPQLTTTSKDASGASTTKEGLAVPVLVEGSLDAPKYRPDVASALQDAIKDPSKLKDQLKNSKGAIKNLKGLLKGFN